MATIAQQLIDICERLEGPISCAKFDEQEAANASLVLLKSLIDASGGTPTPAPDSEVFYTAPVSICAGGSINAVTRQAIVWDSLTGTATANVTEYSVDGVAWSVTPPAGAITLGACAVAAPQAQVATNTPARYVGDNGPFTGYLQTDINGNPTAFVVLDGNAPSSVNSVTSREYGYSFTATHSSGQKLIDFIAANDPNGNFRDDKVLSISILNEDDVNDSIFEIRAMAKTILKAGRLRSMTWGEGQDYALVNKFFYEFVFASDAEVTVSWEQAEV